MGSPTQLDEFGAWSATPVPGLSVLTATLLAEGFRRHSHEHFVVTINVAGGHSSWYRGATVSIPQGWIGVVTAGEVHTGRPAGADPWCYRAFYPSVALLQDIADECAGRPTSLPYFPEVCIRDPDLAMRLSQTHFRCERETERLDLEIEVYTSLGLLLARHAEERLSEAPLGPERAAVRRVREYLEANLAPAPCLHDLAGVANLSRFHLLRVFRRDTGLAPHEYLTQLRIERAKRLLAAGEPISAVALAVGFSDQSHLNRRFKRLVGVTPGRFVAGLWRGGSGGIAR
jgi:AraC-like DNA-binding protein